MEYHTPIYWKVRYHIERAFGMICRIISRRIPTYVLSQELEKREGVDHVIVPPYANYQISHLCRGGIGVVDQFIEGPAIILVVID